MDGLPFSEELRKAIATRSKPNAYVFVARCRKKQHPLLWLVPWKHGLVPVGMARRPPSDLDTMAALRDHYLRIGGSVESVDDRRTRLHAHYRPLSLGGEPMFLSEWPDDERLPTGCCECLGEVEFTSEQVEAWLRAGHKKVLLPE